MYMYLTNSQIHTTYPGPLGTGSGMLSLTPQPALFQRELVPLPTSQLVAKMEDEAHHLKGREMSFVKPN